MGKYKIGAEESITLYILFIRLILIGIILFNIQSMSESIVPTILIFLWVNVELWYTVGKTYIKDIYIIVLLILETINIVVMLFILNTGVGELINQFTLILLSINLLINTYYVMRHYWNSLNEDN